MDKRGRHAGGACDGLDAIDIRGAGGRSLKGQWVDGPRTLFGMLADEFPNLFMIMGPYSHIGNDVRSTEFAVEWLSDLLAEGLARGATRIAARPEVVQAWLDHVVAGGTAALTSGVESSFTGVNSNVAGRDKPASSAAARTLGRAATPRPPEATGRSTSGARALPFAQGEIAGSVPA